jgi:hypothetical protein
VSLGGTTPQPTGREYVAAAQPDERLKPYDDGPQQNQSGQTGSNNNNEQQREGTQRALVISRTSQVLSEKGVQFNGNIDESLSTKCDLGGGNCAFKILNDKLREAVNKALGTPKDSLGAHTGSENRDHNFYMSLHHNNDSLHIDHFNAYRIFPIGAALHGLSDVIIGTLFYGSRTAFAY